MSFIGKVVRRAYIFSDWRVVCRIGVRVTQRTLGDARPVVMLIQTGGAARRYVVMPLVRIAAVTAKAPDPRQPDPAI
jgi:hypothetical protein